MVNAQRHMAAVSPDVTVVAMPAEAVHSSAADANGAIVAVVTHFTQTVLCATVGNRGLVIAYRLARAFDIELRVVAPAKLMQIFRVTGLESFLSFYPTLHREVA
jgi:hypothetical protein